MKPRLLMTIYANPDYYPPTVYAVRILSNYFKVHILCRSMDEPVQKWPAEVTIERFGQYASSREKESASAATKLIEYVKFAARTRALIKQIEPEIVYSYDPHAFVASMLGRMGSRATPLIFHLHEVWESADLPWSSLQKWIVRAAQKGTKSADAAVFPERYRARYWMETAGDARAPIIVPNCPGQNYFPAPADWSETIAIRYRARELLYVGSVGADNCLLEALRAMAMTECHGIRMRVIGSFRPGFEDSFSTLAHELGLGERVSVDGWIDHDEVPARASRTSVGLALYKPLNRSLEYMGSASNKLFEYAAMGLPVVVPDRESYRDFLGDAEWVSYADVEPESIARAIASIFADRERYVSMSRAARRAFEDQYYYERVFGPALERIFELSGMPKPGPASSSELTEAS